MRNPNSKILSAEQARRLRDSLDSEGKKLVFTNGCFDILHRGHLTYLNFARNQGDALLVGLNSDASVRTNKGDLRPINPEDDRSFIMAGLECVDAVVISDDKEPRGLIEKVLPHVLVKGKDWAHYVSGRDVVESHGGCVVLAEMVENKSTTGTIERILQAYSPRPQS